MPYTDLNVVHYDFARRRRLSIAILSDTHGKLNEDVEKVASGSDIILHAGDIVGGQILHGLQSAGRPVIAVRGNNDTVRQWCGAFTDTLQSLPDIVHIELPGGRLTMEHGHRIRDTRHYHARLRMKHPQAKMIVYGHTHVETIDRECEPWIVNPGAAGRTRTRGGPSCLRLNICCGEWQVERHKFDLPPLPGRPEYG